MPLSKLSAAKVKSAGSGKYNDAIAIKSATTVPHGMLRS
jgi:hypothetical protein